MEESLSKKSSARQAILLHLKKSEHGLTVDELSSLLNITPMAVRRHLGVLEGSHLIQSTVQRRPKGRPANVYSLTENAHDLFPNNYSGLLNILLECLEETNGAEAIHTIFSRWRDRLVNVASKELDGLTGEARIRRLGDLLDDEGFMPSFEQEKDGSYLLKQYNCPMRKVAEKYDDVCHFELEVYRALLGPDATRLQRIVDGHACCAFRFSAAGAAGTSAGDSSVETDESSAATDAGAAQGSTPDDASGFPV